MAREIYAFDAVIPHGTLKTAPVTVNMTMPARVVETIEIVLPPGAAGSVGFQFATGGIPMIPSNAGGFIIPTPGLTTWPVEEQITSGAWQMIAYNTGGYNHALQVRFLCALLSSAAPVLGSLLIPNVALSSDTALFAAQSDAQSLPDPVLEG